MTAVVKEVYDAFRKAGVPDKEAWDAAAALSTHETRFGELRGDIDGVKRELTAEIDGVRRDLTTEIDGVRRDLTTEIEGVRRDLTTEMEGLRRDVERRFDDLDRRLGTVERELGEVKRDVAELRAELRMHRWVLGFIVALNVGILLRLFTM